MQEPGGTAACDRDAVSATLTQWLLYHWGSRSHTTLDDMDGPSTEDPMHVALICVCNVLSERWGDGGTQRVLRSAQPKKTTRWALVTGRTSFRTDGLGPLPGPSVAFL